MGKRGPQAQPTKLKLLNGETDKRRLNPREPRPAGGLPSCPERLTGAARDEWERLVPILTEMGVGTDADASALELLCETWGRYVEARQHEVKGGMVWMSGKKSDSGLPSFVYSPYGAIATKLIGHLRAMYAAFGLTPSSRSGIAADKRTTDDELADLIA
jgi:P27 family predicted phage terminase small subunit